MDPSILVVGGGIGGLAAAVAASREGKTVHLLEQAPKFAEIGAGVQLGPNVVRILQAWGLNDRLVAVAAFPERLEVRNALTAQTLGVLPLGKRTIERYGAAYSTIARADLHGLLLSAAQGHGVELQLSQSVVAVEQSADVVQVTTLGGSSLSTPLLIGADGVWGKVRHAILGPQMPRATGHLAFRSMVAQADLPAALRSQVVTAWLGPKFHAVQYPVRSGSHLNVVVIVQGQSAGDPTSWDHSANAGELRVRLANAQAPLLDLIHAIDDWRLWPLYDRPPMASASEQAQGRIALLGDAAHPMRPYLAQGAGMAIEDANQLAVSLQQHAANVPVALQHYAHARWRRNARVQARAIRNGEIFHLKGALRIGRDASLKLLGQHLLDVPWLYDYGR